MDNLCRFLKNDRLSKNREILHLEGDTADSFRGWTGSIKTLKIGHFTR
jgi:hypothetical protein